MRVRAPPPAPFEDSRPFDPGRRADDDGRMPERTTTTGTLAVTTSVLALMLALTGCGQFTVPVQGDPFPAPPTRSIDELLGVDRGDDGALFDAASDAILAELLDHARAVSEQADADLASAIREHPAGDGPSATGP